MGYRQLFSLNMNHASVTLLQHGQITSAGQTTTLNVSRDRMYLRKLMSIGLTIEHTHSVTFASV